MKLKKFGIVALLISGMTLTSCNTDDDAPAEENDQEVITNVKLIFTSGSNVVEVTASDPDGAGVLPLAVNGPINLDANKTYRLTYEIKNNLTSPGVDIKAEIEDEKDVHQFFYSFTNNAFTSPTGDGNFDSQIDNVNYQDYDSNSNPVGLETEWTTAGPPININGGSFSVKLKHQPGIKSSTSSSNDGDTDIDLTFVLNIN